MVGSHQFALFKCSDICAEKAKKGGGKCRVWVRSCVLLYIPQRGLEKGIEEICKTGSMLGNPVFTNVCTLLKHHRLLM